MSPFNRKDFIKTILGGGLASFLNIPFANKLLDSSFSESQPKSLSELETDEEWERIRELFPLQKSISYFNTAGLGSSPISVLNSLHQHLINSEIKSSEDRNDLLKLKKNLGDFIGAEPQDLAFTRNTTEGINIVARELSFKKGDEIVSTSHEHVGGASPWIMLEKEMGIKVKLVELDLTGQENYELIRSQINSKTKLVCISHVCCTTGMILPVKQISEYCKSQNIPLCVDGAQASGLIPINIKELDVDFYVSCGHKWLFGPKGTGFIFVNKRVLPLLKPLFAGAYSDKSFDLIDHQLEFEDQISRLEYGTRNWPLIHGLNEALNFHRNIGFEGEVKRNQELAEYFKRQLQSIESIEILSPSRKEFSSSIVTFRMAGIDYKKLWTILLETYKHRLRAIYENRLNGLRVSIAIYNNKKQIDQLIKDLNEIAKQL